MPPKFRRPAAAVGRRIRRPAVAPGVAGGVQWKEAAGVALGDFPVGISVVAEGSYWEGEVNVCGLVTGALIDGEERYLKIQGTGTQSESLLKYLTGTAERECVVHLCGRPCGAKVWRDGLVHAEKLRRVTGRREDWMDNLGAPPVEPVDVDVNAKLRREADAARKELEERERQRGEQEKTPEEKKDPKKKKKKKKGDRKVKASDGKEDLAMIYAGTGLDPSPDVRRAVVRKARKVRKQTKKRKKKDSSTSSPSSSTSSSSSSEMLIESELFEGQRESQKIWRRTPGALALGTVLEAQQALLTRQGVQPEVHRGPLPPIMVQYYRGQLQPSMTPALSRESHHWSTLVDLLLQGEVARGVDLACQRLKSLEGYAKGVTLDVTRQMELVPHEKASLATQTETTKAGRYAEEENKAAHKTRYAGKGGEPSGSYFGGGKKGKSKGDGKKGKAEGKNSRKGKEEEREKAA